MDFNIRRSKENMKDQFQQRWDALVKRQEALLAQPNTPDAYHNGIVQRYQHPVITHEHIPLNWRYDQNPDTNPTAWNASASIPL